MNDNLAYFLIFIFATSPSFCKGESTREDQFRGSDRSLSEPNSDVAHSHRSNRALILPGALVVPNLEVNGTLWKSPTGARRDVNSTGESEGVMDRLFKMGEYLLDVFNDDSDEDDAPSASQEVQGRSRKMNPWVSLLPFYKGFYLAGLTTAAYVVIKLFIVQSIFASKLALILGFYFVLEKIAMNIAAKKSTTTRKIVYHSEPQYVYPAEKEVYSLPQPTYSVSHTTGDVEIETLNQQSHSGASEPKSHPYSGFTDTTEAKFFSYDGKSDENNAQQPASYSDELQPVALPYSVSETSEMKYYPSYASQAERSESKIANTNYPESNAISDDSAYEQIPAEMIHSSHYEQIPAVLANSYSIPDSSNQASNNQYYYAVPPNSTAAVSSTAVPDLQKTPIHVIAADSPASRPIGRRVFRRLPIVHHRQRQRF